MLRGKRKGGDEMNHKSTSVTLTMFILSLLLLTVTSFAWFAITNYANVDGFVVSVSDYEAEITFSIKKNGGEAQILETESELQAFFANSFPSDYYDVEVIIENKSTTNVNADVYFEPITSLTSNVLYDMRNVFLIDNGTLSLNNQSVALSLASTDPITFDGQTLSMYRLNNLIDLNDRLSFTSGFELDQGQFLVIKFRLLFDPTTESKAYQAGQLKLGKLVVVLNSTEEQS